MKNLKVWICILLLIGIVSACGAKVPAEEEAVTQPEEEVLQPEQELTEAPEEIEPDAVGAEETDPEQVPFASYDEEGIWIYFPNTEGTDLASEQLPHDTDITSLIEEIKQRGLMTDDTEVLDLTVGTATTMYENGAVVSSKPSNTLRAELRLSEEYMNTFAGATSAREDRLKVRALVNTLLKYLQADELLLLCNEKPIETEYCDFDEILYFADPE